MLAPLLKLILIVLMIIHTVILPVCNTLRAKFWTNCPIYVIMKCLRIAPSLKISRHVMMALMTDKRFVCCVFKLSRKKEIIKKRFMFDWRTREDFVAPVTDSGRTAEELANYVFSELLAKGFIEPFSEKHTLDCLVNKCRVNPFVRVALIALAMKAKFFYFDDDEGNRTSNFSSSCRACLLAGEELEGECSRVIQH
ncbi:hypothetical protein Vadar_015130 [Vaccinium darrowii]|uniref:Uncharacterized protein n=1 Tax=Vaccinium darrowii TaxID=229202 RepID=A0ACB7YNY8_9ERIC|nr:hypothetical protein Vadar_015130 [Vaccinium darrowii]